MAIRRSGGNAHPRSGVTPIGDAPCAGEHDRMAEVLIFLQRPPTLSEAEMRTWLLERAGTHRPKLAIAEPDHRDAQQALLQVDVEADSVQDARTQLNELMTDMRLVGLRPAFGRLESIQAGNRNIVLAFVKNPISYNTTLRTILGRPGQKHILSVHSNALTDGEDFAWLWDIELEELTPQVASLVTSGTKAEELAMRFKYAGVPENITRVIPDRAAALDAALATVEPGGTLYILSGYTPLQELRRVMVQRGWVPPFWEE